MNAIKSGETEEAVRLVIEHLNHIENTLDLSIGEEQEVDLDEIFG